ncbi:MAG: DNA methyltransferase [Chloroflexota bacterium]
MQSNSPETLDCEDTDYVFVLGKNWKLSLAELVSFFEARNIKLRFFNLSKSFSTANIEKSLNTSTVNELGGTLKIGKIVSQVPTGIVKDAFLRGKKEAKLDLETSLPKGNTAGDLFLCQRKCVFGVSLYFDDSQFFRVYGNIHRFVGSHFKNELAAHGVRARFMGFPRNRKLPQLTNVEVLKKRLVAESAEILFCIGAEDSFLAKTVAAHDPFEFQKRDVGRPVQRKIFSIPPRLAKILVNLSMCQRGKVFLDPFCGVGTILQEALLAGACVIGVDVNPWCVEASRTNLDWLEDEYKLADASCEVLQGDACNLNQIHDNTVDCIATEPDLGPALRDVPTESYARRIVVKLKPLYSGFLSEAHRTLSEGGRLALVSPYIRTHGKGFVAMDVEGMAKAVGFRSVSLFGRDYFSGSSPLIEELVGTSFFVDVMKRHKIGRKINVFTK